MSDPRPLHDEGATSFERQLLDAAVRERPSPEMLASMQSGLGLGATAAKATTGAAGTFAGYAAITLLAVGGAVIGLVSLRDVSPAAKPVAPVHQVERAVPIVVPAPVVPVPAAPSAALPAAAGVAPDAASPSPEPTVRARARPKSDIRDEIRLVDQARSSLRSGSAERAVTLLDQYVQRYPRGAFRQEVAVLRVEAFERLGERRRASALAREFLNQHPESPHSERVSKALEASSKSAASSGAK